MKDAGKGSIVHDAWSKFGSDFFALFATYKATRDIVEDGIARTVIGPVVSLLSVAPLHTPVRETVDCQLQKRLRSKNLLHLPHKLTLLTFVIYYAIIMKLIQLPS